jgi:hypothetical protein
MIMMQRFDVLSGVLLTACAAIVVSVLCAVIGRDTMRRAGLALILGAWFVLVVILAATGALGSDHGIGTPGLGLAVALPIVLMSIALLRAPSLRQSIMGVSLAALVVVHIVRVLGVDFLILQAAGRLPAPFAPTAGWGDIVTGLAAAPVAWMVHRRAAGWRGALLAWNLFGLLDLVAAVSLGVLSAPGPLRRIFAEPGSGLMTTLPWLLIPGFLVPLLFTSHLAIFYRLARSSRSVEEPRAMHAIAS